MAPSVAPYTPRCYAHFWIDVISSMYGRRQNTKHRFELRRPSKSANKKKRKKNFVAGTAVKAPIILRWVAWCMSKFESSSLYHLFFYLVWPCIALICRFETCLSKLPVCSSSSGTRERCTSLYLCLGALRRPACRIDTLTFVPMFSTSITSTQSTPGLRIANLNSLYSLNSDGEKRENLSPCITSASAVASVPASPRARRRQTLKRAKSYGAKVRDHNKDSMAYVVIFRRIWTFIMKLVWHQSHSCFVMTSACFLQHVHLGVGGSGEGVNRCVTIVYIFCTQKSSTVNRYISSKRQGVRVWVKLLHIPAISLWTLAFFEPISTPALGILYRWLTSIEATQQC